MWPPENRLSALSVLECLIMAHLSFLSNQEALWDGHLLIPVSFPFHPLLIWIWGWGSVGTPGPSLWVTPKEVFWCGSTHLEMKAQNAKQVGMESLTSSCASCTLLQSPQALQQNFLIYWCSSGMRHANWLWATALNFLYSPGGNSYSRSFSATPDFLGLCREHTKTKIVRLGGDIPKATAALAQNKSPVTLRDTGEVKSPLRGGLPRFPGGLGHASCAQDRLWKWINWKFSSCT